LRDVPVGLQMRPSSKTGAPSVGSGVPDLTSIIEKPKEDMNLEINIYKKRANDPSVMPDITHYPAPTPSDVAIDPRLWSLRVKLAGKSKVTDISVGTLFPLPKSMQLTSELFTFIDFPSMPMGIKPGDFYYLYYRLLDTSGNELDHNWIEFKVA
jgi:hypothetical protein